MAGEQQETESQFNARADRAALALRQSLKRRGVEIADSRSVEVGPDGHPPAPPPPKGSYARQAIEQQQAAAAAQRRQLGDQPIAGTTEQAIDGSQAPPLTNGQPPQEPAEQQLTPNAQRRITELVNDLRRKEQELQHLGAESKSQGEAFASLQAKLEAMTKQHETLVQASLDHLDPEARMQVMQDARLNEAFAHFENRLMQKLMPQLHTLEQKSAHAEMMRLAETYPAFDLQIHGPLIEMFRGKNPACTIEQAFRAIAEGDELTTRSSASAAVVPPIVPPGSGSAAQVRYTPEPKSDPEQELVEEAQQLRRLMASEKPEERRDGMRLMDQHLIKRLGNRIPH